MAAFEATGDNTYLGMAESIAELLINHHARALGWRVAEHFDAAWGIDRAYAGDPIFRPSGITPGHALEWSRLLVQLWELGERRKNWMPVAARHLFLNAVNTGWDTETGGCIIRSTGMANPTRQRAFGGPAPKGLQLQPHCRKWWMRRNLKSGIAGSGALSMPMSSTMNMGRGIPNLATTWFRRTAFLSENQIFITRFRLASCHSCRRKTALSWD